MPACEGMVSEETVIRAVNKEIERDVDVAGEIHTLMVPSVVNEIEVIPAHPCPNEATMLARSMDEQTCNLESAHWVTIEDHYYCALHFVPGRMAHLDGTNTDHAPMAIA